MQMPKYIKIFTFNERDSSSRTHEAPHLRILQKRLAEEVTTMAHSALDLIMQLFKFYWKLNC
jgi:tyrosyl-tRNA synthetase